jgi:hypothetical protein
MVRVWCRGGVVKGVVPEFLEELVGPAAEQDRVEKRNAVHGRFGLLLVGHDPVQIAVSSGKIPVCGHPVKHHDSAARFHGVLLSRHIVGS